MEYYGGHSAVIVSKIVAAAILEVYCVAAVKRHKVSCICKLLCMESTKLYGLRITLA